MRLIVSEQAQTAAAAALGTFLTVLHGQEIGRAVAAGIPGRSNGIRMIEKRDEAAAHVDTIAPLLDSEIDHRCGRFLNDPTWSPGDTPGPDRLIHANLTAEHILLDPGSGDITGIIDWSDMRIDDIAFDLAGLWHWQGDHGVDIALRHYGGQTDPGMRDRIRCIGIWKAFEDLRYGRATGDSGYIDFSIRCLQRMFGA